MAIINHLYLMDFYGHFRLGMLGGIFHFIKILIVNSVNKQWRP